MKNQKPDAERVWKQFEDVVAPRLGFSLIERAIYLHLLRHSRLEGKERFHFSLNWLARGIRISREPVRAGLRRLVQRGALRLLNRSTHGHMVEVRLPDEIRIAWDPRLQPDRRKADGAAIKLENINFFENPERREAIYNRERGLCFYCLRRLEHDSRQLDHVVPLADGGDHSYRNLVSCCADCNFTKSGKGAADFLRGLYRDGRLTADEFRERLRMLKALARGELRVDIGITAEPTVEVNDGRSE